MTGLALVHGRDANARLGAACRFLERDFQVVAEVRPAVDVGASAPAAAPQAAAEPAKPSLLGRLFGKTEEPRRVLDDAMLESLEDLLIQADMGVETATRVTANIAEGRFGRKIGATELRQALADEVARIMEPVARPLPLYPQKPQVVLVVGVNGSKLCATGAFLF